jgi:DNA-binding NtrC family response regulator
MIPSASHHTRRRRSARVRIEAMAPRSNEAPTGPRPHILILDDEPGVRDALRIIIESEGIMSQFAETSDEALELAERHRFDVILSDIAHPGVNGLDLLPVWKQSHPNIPVILMSAQLDDEKIIPQAISLGAFACVPKPFTVEGVMATVRAALRS